MKNIILLILTVSVLAGAGLYVWNQTSTSSVPPELNDTNEEIEYTTHTFTCPSGDKFSITYNDQNEEATLLIEGDMAYLLTPAVSASGARYTDTGGHIEFWEHQDEATVRLNEEVLYEHCVPEGTESPSNQITDLITVTGPTNGLTVSSPINLSGEARGYWFFEASAPVVVVDWDGRIIGQGYVTAEGDWMTEDFVPFSGSVTYELPDDVPYRRGAIIFQKYNPSGLPENDAALEIPVNFE